MGRFTAASPNLASRFTAEAGLTEATLADLTRLLDREGPVSEGARVEMGDDGSEVIVIPMGEAGRDMFLAGVGPEVEDDQRDRVMGALARYGSVALETLICMTVNARRSVVSSASTSRPPIATPSSRGSSRYTRRSRTPYWKVADWLRCCAPSAPSWTRIWSSSVPLIGCSQAGLPTAHRVAAAARSRSAPSHDRESAGDPHSRPLPRWSTATPWPGSSPPCRRRRGTSSAPQSSMGRCWWRWSCCASARPPRSRPGLRGGLLEELFWHGSRRPRGQASARLWLRPRAAIACPFGRGGKADPAMAEPRSTRTRCSGRWPSARKRVEPAQPGGSARRSGGGGRPRTPQADRSGSGRRLEDELQAAARAKLPRHPSQHGRRHRLRGDGRLPRFLSGGSSGPRPSAFAGAAR